jgi:hypothetical protein
MKPMEIGDALVLHETLISYASHQYSAKPLIPPPLGTAVSGGKHWEKGVSLGTIILWIACYHLRYGRHFEVFASASNLGYGIKWTLKEGNEDFKKYNKEM